MENHIYEIHTERLIIRCYQLSDSIAFSSAVQNSIENLIPWMDRAKKPPKDTTEKIAIIRKFRGEFDLNKDYVYGIFAKDNKTLLGSTGLHNRNKNGGIEIGYWINSEDCGQGYCTEAVKALIKTGFEILGLDYIDIRCDEKNSKSSNIPRKLGFTHESTIRVNQKTDSGERIKHQLRRLFREEYLDDPISLQISRFDALGGEIYQTNNTKGLLDNFKKIEKN